MIPQYNSLLILHTDVLCSLVHRFYNAHNLSKGYSNWPEMRQYALGRRDVSRTIIRDALSNLNPSQKKIVIAALRRTIAYCKQVSASATTASAK